MTQFTQLVCPQCHFHVADLAPPKPAAKVPVDDVKAWLEITSWSDYEAPSAIYQRYRNWAVAAGRDPLSQRSLSYRLTKLGSRFRSTTGGRVYAPPPA